MKLPAGISVETARLHQAALIPGLGSKKVLDAKEMKMAKMSYVVETGLYIESGGKLTLVPFTAVESIIFASEDKLKK